MAARNLTKLDTHFYCINLANYHLLVGVRYVIRKVKTSHVISVVFANPIE